MRFDIKAFLYPYNSTMYIMLNFRKRKNFKLISSEKSKESV